MIYPTRLTSKNPQKTVLDTPSSHPEKPGEYTCQILTSWPYRPGFLGRSDPIDIPASNADRIAFMKTLAAGWAEPFRSVVLDIPPHAEPTAISLEDWPPPRRSQHWRQGKRDVEAEKEKGEEGRTVWERATGGRVTLAGDAAHAMVMCKLGELFLLLTPLLPLLLIDSFPQHVPFPANNEPRNLEMN